MLYRKIACCLLRETHIQSVNKTYNFLLLNLVVHKRAENFLREKKKSWL
jgi:hypothetical protein